MPEEKKSFVTMWRIILALIFAAGIYATYLRFAVGWHAATNMSDAQPWGIWVGLATLCGVGLSAGGFATAAAVYLLGMERYRPICRTAIMIALLGYGSVCVGYAYELGLPWRFWHPLVYWNRHSVLFEVCWCIIMYTTVLMIEFSPAVVEKLPWKRVRETYLGWHHRIVIAFVLAGVPALLVASVIPRRIVHHHQRQGISAVVQHTSDHSLLHVRDSGRHYHDRDGFISIHSLA